MPNGAHILTILRATVRSQHILTTIPELIDQAHRLILRDRSNINEYSLNFNSITDHLFRPFRAFEVFLHQCSPPRLILSEFNEHGRLEFDGKNTKVYTIENN